MSGHRVKLAAHLMYTALLCIYLTVDFMSSSWNTCISVPTIPELKHHIIHYLSEI